MLAETGKKKYIMCFLWLKYNMKCSSNICVLGNEVLDLGINGSGAHALGDKHPPHSE